MKLNDITGDKNAILYCYLNLKKPKKTPGGIILDFHTQNIALAECRENRKHNCCFQQYVFDRDSLLAVRINLSGTPPEEGAEEILEKMVLEIRRRHPNTGIIFRGGVVFSKDSILSQCEKMKILYVIGMNRSSRLKELIKNQRKEAKEKFKERKKSSRVFTRFSYLLTGSWKQHRDIVAKAEYLPSGENPRFIVTNISSDTWADRPLYEVLYCGHVDLEKRVKIIRSSKCAFFQLYG